MKYSFIVTCYNEEKSIVKCLRSILRQPYDNFEIIVINDGSTDKSKDLIVNVLKDFKNKTVINQKNKGLSISRNVGINFSKGDYIMFVDGDDYILENYLTILESVIKNKPEIIKFNLRKEYRTHIVNSKPHKNLFGINGVEALLKLIAKKESFEPAVLYAFKRDFINKTSFFFEANRYHEDFGLIPMSILKAQKVTILSDILYSYVQTEDSITRTNDKLKKKKRFYDMLYFYDKIEEEVLKQNYSKKTKRIILSYISNALILSSKEIPIEIKQKEIFKRQALQYIANNGFKGKIKYYFYRRRLLK